MKAPTSKQLPAPADKRQVSPRSKSDRSTPPWTYSTMPNAFDDLIADGKLSGVLQRDVIWIILRATWGADGRPEYARLSLREIARRCREDSGNVGRAVADLAKRKILEINEGKGCSKTAKLYKLIPENWKDAAPYEAPKAKPVDDEADDAEGTDEDNPQHKRLHGGKLIVRPGKKPARTAARLEPKDREPVDFKIEYANTGTSPVEVSATTTADVLTITVNAKATESERKENKRVFPTAPHQTPLLINQRLTEFSTAICELSLSEFQKPLDPADPTDRKYISDICELAGPDLPAAEYAAYARSEIRTMREGRKNVASGILRPLATQAATRHARLKQAKALHRPAPNSQPVSDDDENAWLEQIRRDDPAGYEDLMRQRELERTA